MKKNKRPLDNQITINQSPDGGVNIEIMYADENIWLTQKRMAELFDTTPQNITLHLKNIYEKGEIEYATTCKDFLQVQQEGRRHISRRLMFDSLEAIIAVGYRKIDGFSKIFETKKKTSKDFQHNDFTVNAKLLLKPKRGITDVPDNYKQYWFDNFADFGIKVLS